MRTDLEIVADARRLPAIHASGALSARRTGSATVHMIGTAATPLGGDHLEITVRVGPGARLVVRSVAATIALPGTAGALSTSRWTYEVADGGVLDVDPEPMIVAASAEHHSSTVVRLAGTAQLRLRERVQIGRTGEDGGRWRGELVADVGTTPLLRHALQLGRDTIADDVLSAPRAVESELRFPDSRAAQVTDLKSTLLPLAVGGTLHTRWGTHL